MTDKNTTEVRLKKWPKGMPEPDDFELAETTLPDLEPGNIQVRNLFMSVDPYMRGRLRPGKSYVASYLPGEVLTGGAVGVVEESRSENIPKGAAVLSDMGFRTRFVAESNAVRPIHPEDLPLSAYIGIMGMPGKTAYVGLTEIGRPNPGETVFVSGGAGAVGSAVCQIAKIKGCRVVASAGSTEKVAWLKEIAGVDAAFNYKDFRNLGRELRRKCPEGIDVTFDNVGGDHLEAAMSNMNDFGRIVCCGMISGYNDTEIRPGPTNLMQIVVKRLRVQGFIVSDHEAPEFEDEMGSWIRSGSIRWEETVVDGIDRAVDALIGLFSGDNLGKMIVKLRGPG